MCSDPMLGLRRLRHQRGASIVELMIGLVISLLVGLAATGAAINFMAQQRSGVGATGVSVNTNSVMSVLRDDVASAGLGFYGEGAALCATLQLSVNGARLMDGVAFAPLQVTRQAAADMLDVTYASNVASGATVRLHEPSDGSAATLKSLLPVTVGQAVLLTPAPRASASGPCLVRTVTGLVAGTPEEPRPQLAFAASGLHNAVAFSTPASFNNEARLSYKGAKPPRTQMNNPNNALVFV
jgi:hypothetical protein